MIGHDRIIYTMTMDGLEDAYSPGKPMGAFAQDAANDYQFTREMQDAYAACSLDRARATISSGAIAGEIVAVEIKSRTGSVIADTDEQPGQATPEKFPDLRPVFAAEGSITAASSASMSVDAAALVLTRLSKATALDVKPIARVVGSAAHAQAPALSTTAPVKAIEKLLAVDRRGGSSRGEKGLRCGRDDCSQGSHHPDEKIQCEWRHDRARAPDRSLGRKDHRNIACRAGTPGWAPRHRQSLHRGWRSDRHGFRTV